MIDSAFPMSSCCPVCSESDWHVVLHRENVPVCCHQLADDADSARDIPRGEVELCQCNHCSVIYNRRFDSVLIDYTEDYENALHFSPRFARYLEELAGDLQARHGLNQSRILEIGCGDGTFLNMLTTASDSRGVGFEPSAPRVKPEFEAAVDIRTRTFTSIDATGQFDLACLRHVVEHVPDPVPLMTLMKSALNEFDGGVYVEVPNADYMLRSNSVWDVLYEHCLYFTVGSLGRLLKCSGFTDVEVEERFGGQFLAAHGKVASNTRPGECGDGLSEGVETIQFGSRCEQAVIAVNTQVRGLSEAGKRIGIWGAGTKGMMLLNALDEPHSVSAVFDINPRKHGRYIPGAALPIYGPESDAMQSIDVLMVMNPMYVDEIRSQLQRLGHSPELIAA